MDKTTDDSGQTMASTVPTAKDLVQGVVTLVSLPEVCIRISEMVDEPKVSAAQIGKVISQDAALTARLLRIVNSAFYRFPAKIETVTRAIAIIGHRDLRDLVLAASISGVFERMANDLVDIDHFWRHGIYSGILARIMAKNCRVLHSERLFIGGLLHDIGRLILGHQLPQLSRQAVDLARVKNIRLYQAEQHVFGYTHADVGAELMHRWGLPVSHQNTTRFHHEPEKVKDFALECAIVYLSDRISHLAEQGDYKGEDLIGVPDKVWRLTRQSPAGIEALLLESREQFIEALQVFRPRGEQNSSFAA